MAVEVRNSSSSGDKGSATSYTFAHTVHADSNFIVVCTYARDSSSEQIAVSGVTYNSVGLNKV